MRLLRNSLLVLLCLGAGSFRAADNPPFRPGPASSFRNHQTISKLTIAAEACGTRERTHPAFGKLNPNKYGILPVLVVMQNDSDRALRLDGMRVEYIRPDHKRLEPIPAEEVKYIHGPRRPNTSPKPYPVGIPGLGGKKKSPLANSEIEERAFAAKMLPPHDDTHGFFYFYSADHRGATLYITGITEAATGQELFFFEIPLE